MKTIRTMLLLPAVAPALLAAQETVPPVGCSAVAPREAIQDVRGAYMEAFNAGRLTEVLDLHTEDVVSMPAGHPPSVGRDALSHLMTESLTTAPPGFHFEFEAREVRIAEEWVIEWGVTHAYLDDEETAVPSGKYVLLYEQDGAGCWRIAWSITNSDGTGVQ